MMKLEPDFILGLRHLFVCPEFNVISLTYLFSQDEIMITYSDEHFDKINVAGIEGRTLEIICQIAETIKKKMTANLGKG